MRHIDNRPTTSFLAHSCCWLFASALIGSPQCAAGNDACPPLALPAVTAVTWDQDTAYEVSVRDMGEGKLRVTVVGDILIVDKERFASLARTVDKAPANVAEIVLDARVIKIRTPLSLQNGKLRVYADLLTFEENGLIALTKRPTSANEGVEISATQIDLRQAMPLPIQVAVDASSSRRVTIRADRVTTAGGDLRARPAVQALWERSTNFDGAMPPQLPATWDVDVGKTGESAALANMRAPATWPAYTTYKIRKYHAFAPFDQANQDDLIARMDQLRPKVERLQRAELLLEIDALSLLIKRNLDQRGVGPAYVPSEDFVSAKERFAASRKAAEGQLKNLRTIIASAHKLPTLDNQALEAARSRIASLTQAQEQRHADIGELFTTMSVLQSQGEKIDEAIAVERGHIQQEIEDDKKKQGQLDNLRLATTVVAVGASFIGTPATGAAIATGVGVAGDVVYAHNVGKPVDVQTLVTISQKNAEMYKKFLSAREAWEKHSASLRTARQVFDGAEVIPKDAKKPLTKTEAAKQVGESASDFANKVKDIADSSGAIPKPDMLSLNDYEAKNTELQRHLARLVDVQRKTSEATARLNSLQSSLVVDERAIAETRSVEQVLLELKPGNDQEVLRWKTAALQLWNRALQSLYQDAMDLRRSLYFETWKTPILSHGALTYPEEFTAYLASGRYSSEAPGATSPVTLTATHLDHEIAKHLAVLDGIASSVDTTWATYQAERAAGTQPFFDPHDLSSRAGAPASVRMFMSQVNAQIVRQIQNPETRGGQFPLLIPFDMTAPPAALPERLLQVGVIAAQVGNPAAMVGKELVFDVTYRLAGELNRDSQCAYVDLSLPNGAKTAVFRSSSKDLASESDKRIQAESPLTFDTLRRSRAAPPARTLYFLSVTVAGSPQDSNWSNAPMLDSFTFWRRIVQ